MPKWLTRLLRRDVSTVYAFQAVVESPRELKWLWRGGMTRTEALATYERLLMNDSENKIFSAAVVNTRRGTNVREYSPWTY